MMTRLRIQSILPRALIAALAGFLAVPAAMLPRPAAAADAPTTTAPAAGTRTRGVGEAIRMQEGVKQQWTELIRSMHQVATELENSDPQSARAIARAAQKAEEALVGDDMDKVAKLLAAGLIVPADATQANVIRKLRDVLETLRAGGDDLDGKFVQLEQMAQMIEALKALLLRQKELERHSRAVAFGPDILAKLSAASGKVQALSARQQQVAERTKGLKLDPTTEQIVAAAQTLQALLKRQDTLIKELADPYPSPDKMAADIVGSRSVAAEATTVRVSVKTTMNSPAIAQPAAGAGVSGDAAAVEAAVGRMVEELGKTAKALEADDLDGAQVAAAEARSHLLDGLKSLETIAAKMPGAGPAAEIIAAQQQVSDESAPLGADVDDLVPVDEEVAQPKPLDEKITTRGGASRGGVRPATTQPGGATTRPVRVGLASAAVTALRRYDKATAGLEQQAALEAIAQWAERLDTAEAQVKGIQRDPDYPRQHTQQDQIATLLKKASAGVIPVVSRKPAASQPATQPVDGATPSIIAAAKPAAPPWLAGESQVTLGRAADSAADAAGLLSNEKPADANAAQNEVIRLVQSVLEKLQSDFEGFAQNVEQELKDQVVAAVERILLEQKRCTQDTAALWAKRQPDGGYRRAEQLAFVPLATAEGQILLDMDYLQHLMDDAISAHVKVAFPPIVQMTMALVRSDVDSVRQRLLDKNPGEQTQRTQKEIEERLAGMLQSLKKLADSKLDTPPSWGQNGIGNPESARTDRIAEIQLMMVIQSQINRRTAELDKAKAAGAMSADKLGAEFRMLADQQAKLTEMVRNMIAQDAETFERVAHPPQRN